MTDDTYDQVREVFQLYMETESKMNNLIRNEDRAEIIESVTEVTEEIAKKSDSERNKQYLYITVLQFGQALESDDLQGFAIHKLQEIGAINEQGQ